MLALIHEMMENVFSGFFLASYFTIFMDASECLFVFNINLNSLAFFAISQYFITMFELIRIHHIFWETGYIRSEESLWYWPP